MTDESHVYGEYCQRDRTIHPPSFAPGFGGTTAPPPPRAPPCASAWNASTNCSGCRARCRNLADSNGARASAASRPAKSLVCLGTESVDGTTIAQIMSIRWARDWSPNQDMHLLEHESRRSWRKSRGESRAVDGHRTAGNERVVTGYELAVAGPSERTGSRRLSCTPDILGRASHQAA